MRIDYAMELADVDVPRFSVEAVEGIGKLFSLATLVLNVLDTKSAVEIVFHGLNPEDPERKITAFQEILASSVTAGVLRVTTGEGSRVQGSSSYYCWVRVSRD